MITAFVILFIPLLYTIWMCWLWKAWLSVSPATSSVEESSLPSISILIAFRNEEKNLEKLLSSLAQQDYSLEKLELVLVNDHSEDRYDRVLKKFSSFPYPFRLFHLPNGVQGKKQAVSFGLKQVLSEWVLTTDADCETSHQWVKTMITHALLRKADFVFGPVAYRESGRFFYDVQQIELFSLVYSGAALWKRGYPTMCNGANLLYRKSLVGEGEDVYAGNAHLASGDDEFLMHKVYAQNAQSVSFVKDPQALVDTAACVSWKLFFQQRRRWASKWGAYRMMHVKLIALWVFAVNLFYVLLPLCLLCNSTIISWLIGVYVSRWLIDGIFLRKIISFYKKPFNLVSYVGLAIVYPWYVVISALLGRLGSYTWKGRTVS